MIDISVVTPIYGVERYIEHCARSLFEQTITEGVEFIFIDDCTPDGSIDVLNAVLNEYPKRKEQVRIIHHKQNKGLPQARKTGIEAANGKYILNIDSDDWIETNALEVLIGKASATDADIVLFDFARVSEDSDTTTMQKVRINNALSEMLKGKLPWSTCNKLFRRSLYFERGPITFPISFMAEDMVQTYQLVSRANRIKYLPLPLYYYRRPEPSSQKNLGTDARRIFEQTKENIELLINAENLDQKQPIVADRLRLIAKLSLSPSVSSHTTRRDYMLAYPELNIRILFNPIVPMRNRFHHLFIMFGSAHLVPFVKRLIGRLKLTRTH